MSAKEQHLSEESVGHRMQLSDWFRVEACDVLHSAKSFSLLYIAVASGSPQSRAERTTSSHLR